MATISLQQAPSYTDVRGIEATVRGSSRAIDYVPLLNLNPATAGIQFSCSNTVAELNGRNVVRISYNNHDDETIAISSIHV